MEFGLTRIVRLYGPEPEMTNGSWVYPKVSVVDAIRE